MRAARPAGERRRARVLARTDGEAGNRLGLALGLGLAAALAWGLVALPCHAKAKRGGDTAAAGTITARDGMSLAQAGKAPAMQLSPDAGAAAKGGKDDGFSLRLDLGTDKPRDPKPVDPLSGSTSTAFGETQVDMGWKLRGTNLSMTMKPGGSNLEVTSKLELRDKRMKVGVRMPF